MKSNPTPSSIPPWLAYAVLGVLHLIAVAGLLGSLEPEAAQWLVVCVLCTHARRHYAAWRASLLVEPAEKLENPEPVAEPAKVCGPPLRLRPRPVLAEHTFVVCEPAEVCEPARTAGS